MRLEQMMDRRFLGYRSVLGWYRWVKDVRRIITARGLGPSDKLWCIRHGFTPSGFKAFGGEELKKNYADYLSQRDYLKLHPINGAFSVWIDDKLTMKYVLANFDEYLPAYYFHIEKDRIMRLVNCPADIESEGLEGIMELLRAEGILVAKRLWGACGVGFYRLEYRDGRYFVTGSETSEEKLLDLLKGLDHYIITEHISNHSVIRSIWPEATNTMRLLMASIDGKQTVMRAFIRFGNKKSNGVDNAHAGGIEAIIEEETGEILFAAAFDAKGRAERITNHPDSGASFDIRLPHWDMIIEKCSEICRSIPELRYWGFDVAITEDSFKILEINSLSGLTASQLKEPLMRDPKTREIYERFGVRAQGG